MAFAIVLGASCKKESLQKEKSATDHIEAEKEIELKVEKTSSIPPPPWSDDYDDGGGQEGDGGLNGPGYPDNENTFPHNTGICTCGRFIGCHWKGSPPNSPETPYSPDGPIQTPIPR